MEIIKNLNYKDTFKIGSFIFNNLDNTTMILQKYKDGGNNNDRFYLRLYSIKNNEIEECGYIYFYIYKIENILVSKFIGMYVHKKYRKLGLADTLISSWISFCKENKIETFLTNERQRKLCLLSLLKNYGFESKNINIFKNGNYTSTYKSTFVVDVFKDPNKDYWYRFKSDKHYEMYKKFKIAQSNNYKYITSNIPQEFEYQTWIAVGKEGKYYVEQNNLNEERISLTLKKHKK